MKTAYPSLLYRDYLLTEPFAGFKWQSFRHSHTSRRANLKGDPVSP